MSVPAGEEADRSRHLAVLASSGMASEVKAPPGSMAVSSANGHWQAAFKGHRKHSHAWCLFLCPPIAGPCWEAGAVDNLYGFQNSPDVIWLQHIATLWIHFVPSNTELLTIHDDHWAVLQNYVAPLPAPETEFKSKDFSVSMNVENSSLPSIVYSCVWLILIGSNQWPRAPSNSLRATERVLLSCLKSRVAEMDWGGWHVLLAHRQNSHLASSMFWHMVHESSEG